ncbi:hypothetical protein QAD02_007920 [Eretmocerus hayati]|uniref:Uncharacterized protein n=1 Tax=Eretmocerus hayati TaxID=131215 RepID=A0ACC2N6C4_9HYME|nr:hypothetical protein QAD02_007920 [Eretmocerus hayati]
MTVREKATSWGQLTEEFNSISNYCPRTVKMLENLWDRMKKTTRGASKFQKNGRTQTGGGDRDTSDYSTNVDQKVLGILGTSGIGDVLLKYILCVITVVILFVHTISFSLSQQVIIMNTGDIKLPPVTGPKIVAKHEVRYSLEPAEIKTEQGKKNRSDVSPRLMYYEKPEALRAGSTRYGTHANISKTPNGPNDTIFTELAWA